MTAAVIAAIGLTALAVFFFLLEGEGLIEGHARTRTKMINTVRWALVIALAWVLIPAAFSEPVAQRGAVILGITGLLGAMMLIPVGWFVRIGGREPLWELRRAKIEVSQLSNRVRRDHASVPPIRLQDAIDRMEGLRTPETSELCSLLAAELADLKRGSESWNEAGRRGIRIDQIGRELWPGAMPPPDFEPDEATFRWHLYRTFGRMMEIGTEKISAASRKEFQRLLATLDEYRRPDTTRFVTDVKKSASRWLAGAAGKRVWIESFDFRTLGPNGLADVRALWGRDAAMWGAALDDADRAAIAADLTRREAERSAETEAAGLDDVPVTSGTPVMVAPELESAADPVEDEEPVTAGA